MGTPPQEGVTESPRRRYRITKKAFPNQRNLRPLEQTSFPRKYKYGARAVVMIIDGDDDDNDDDDEDDEEAPGEVRGAASPHTMRTQARGMWQGCFLNS